MVLTGLKTLLKHKSNLFETQNLHFHLFIRDRSLENGNQASYPGSNFPNMLNGWWWNLISLFILWPIPTDLDLLVIKIEIHVLHTKKYQIWTSWPQPHHEVGIRANDKWLKNAHKFNLSWYIFNKEETRHMCFVLNGSNSMYLWNFIQKNVK